VATTCLFLASKVEETPKKLKDVITETYKVQHSTVQPPDPDSQELWKLKEQILICERELLRVLGFDLSVEHAYRPLLAYIKSISGTRDLAQIAWNFINDSLRTTICLQYAPRCLAAATVLMASDYLGAKLGKPCPLPNHPPGSSGKWFTAFQVREETVQDIVKQIQSMYDSNKSGGGLLSANSTLMAKGGSSAGGAASKGSAAAPTSKAAAAGGGDASGGRASVKRESSGGGGGSGGPSSSSSSGGGGGSGGGGEKQGSAVKSESKEAAGPSASKKESEEGELEEGEVGAGGEPGTKRQKSDSK
jgi:cyclin T